MHTHSSPSAHVCTQPATGLLTAHRLYTALRHVLGPCASYRMARVVAALKGSQ